MVSGIGVLWKYVVVKMPKVVPEKLPLLANIQALYLKERRADNRRILHYNYSVSWLVWLIKEICSFSFHKDSRTKEQEVISFSWHHHPLYQYSERERERGSVTLNVSSSCYNHLKPTTSCSQWVANKIQKSLYVPSILCMVFYSLLSYI